MLLSTGEELNKQVMKAMYTDIIAERSWLYSLLCSDSSYRVEL
jgi:hypothetical protein